jgi:hypothetical protein
MKTVLILAGCTIFAIKAFCVALDRVEVAQQLQNDRLQLIASASE